MKKILAIILGIAIYFIGISLIKSYENKKDHPNLSDVITSKFLSLNNKGTYSMSKFTNFYFDFDYQLTGEDYEKSDMFYRDLKIVTSKYNVAQWIARGSLTADVPEVQASVRHFYDPTVPDPNKRYLQDIAIGPIMSKAQENYPNPHINQIDWAIEGDKNDDPNSMYNHKFTWNNGKKWFREALEVKNKKSKDSLMALVWRSLGETLHMIQDMGCPAHVRDDSHPAPKGYGHILGDPDTYEEFFFEKIGKSDVTAYAGSGKIDLNLKSDLMKYNNIRDLAHNFALWTNKNFFTNQTIAGTNIYETPLKHIAHPHKEYPSPKINSNMYDPNTKYYIGNVAGYEVKHCINHISLYEFLWQGKTKGYPIFDLECVKSQAQILIPNIVEAGVNTIKLYIPKINVIIKDVSNNSIVGNINLTNDVEYPEQSLYSGEVIITNLKNGKKKIVNASGGEFNDKINDLEVKAGDNIEAAISFGGITVFSDKFIAQEQSEGINCNAVKVFITFSSAKFSKTGSSSTYWNHELCTYAGYNDAPYVFIPSEQGKTFTGYWTGNTFKGTAKSNLSGPGAGNISITLSNDLKKINYIETNYENGYSNHNNFIVIRTYLNINNSISSTNFTPGYMVEYEIKNPNNDFITSLSHEIKCKNQQDMVYSLLPKQGKIEKILVRFENTE